MTKYQGNKQGKDKGVAAVLWTEILTVKKDQVPGRTDTPGDLQQSFLTSRLPGVFHQRMER